MILSQSNLLDNTTTQSAQIVQSIIYHFYNDAFFCAFTHPPPQKREGITLNPKEKWKL